MCKPGVVNWKQVVQKFKKMSAMMDQIGNCNYAIDLGKQLRFSLVGIQACPLRENCCNKSSIGRKYHGNEHDKMVILYSNCHTDLIDTLLYIRLQDRISKPSKSVDMLVSARYHSPDQ